MVYDHSAHFLLERENVRIFCGGTEPPTEVIHHYLDDEVIVEVFKEGTNNHVGEINEPIKTKNFLVDDSFTLNEDNAGTYAVKALRAVKG